MIPLVYMKFNSKWKTKPIYVNLEMYYLINVKLSFVLDLVFSSPRQGLALSWLVSSLWHSNLSFLSAELNRCVLPNLTPCYLFYYLFVSSLRRAIKHILNPTFQVCHCSSLFWCSLYPTSILCVSIWFHVVVGVVNISVVNNVPQVRVSLLTQIYISVHHSKQNFQPSTICVCTRTYTYTQTHCIKNFHKTSAFLLVIPILTHKHTPLPENFHS